MTALKFWLRPETKKLQFLYLTFSGLASGFCMAFPSVIGSIIEWLCFIPAALAIFAAFEKKCTLKAAYFGGFWLIYSQNVIVYHWFISFYPLEFTGMTKLAAASVVVVAIFGLALLAALFGGVAGLITLLASRSRLAKKCSLLIPFAASCSYVLSEWIRTQFWFGVPWSRLPLGQLTDGVPYTVLPASVFGSYFVTFLIVLVSFLLAQAIYMGSFKLRTILALSLVASNLLFGIILYNIPDREVDNVRVAAIQGNISSREKWEEDTGERLTSFEIHSKLTLEAAKEDVDLIVWSETALLSLNSRELKELSSICKDYDTNLLFGFLDEDEQGSPRNILMLIDANGELSETIYIKRHLVPFGEYVPMRDFVMKVFPPLAEIGMLSEDLVAGNGSELFTIERNGMEIKLGGLICFDSIYESLAYSSSADGADILCVSTNDSWFEDSRAVYMHCDQSRLRAIETGLPLVRSGNTGISAIITEDGVVTESLEPLVKGMVIGDVELNEPTGDSRILNSVFLSACALFLLVFPIADCAVFLRKKRK